MGIETTLCFSHTQLLIVVLVYIVLWVLLDVGLGGVMAYYLQLKVFCSQRQDESNFGMIGSTGVGCFYYITSGERGSREGEL